MTFVGQHFDFDGSIKSWECQKNQFRLKNNKHAIPQLWKDNIKNFARNLNNLSIQDHYLIKCNRILNLERLNSNELYEIQLPIIYEKPACQAYHEKKFDNYNFDWKIIYGIPRVATYDTKVLILPYKLLINILYLNQKIYQFGIDSCSKCSFYDIHDETALHLFYE